MDLTAYINSDFIALIPILYGIGIYIKKTKIKNSLIPIILGIVSICITIPVTFATATYSTTQEIFSALISSIVQGVLCTATAVYTHQVYKQTTASEGDDANG